MIKFGSTSALKAVLSLDLTLKQNVSTVDTNINELELLT